MGTTYSASFTKAGLTKELTAPYESEAGGRVTTIAHALSGDCLWLVRESERPIEALGGARFITLCLFRRENRMLGYKLMGETEGPYYHSCPLAFLDMVPDPGGYATDWRARVRHEAPVTRTPAGACSAQERLC